MLISQKIVETSSGSDVKKNLC